LLASATANAAPTNPTTTTVACPQTQVFPTEVSNCTITVVDTAAGATAPTGEVHLATVAPPFTNAPGVVRPGTCTLVPAGSSSSTCSAFWTPEKGEFSSAKIAGVYTGDATHITSRSESALLESLPLHEVVAKLSCATTQPALGGKVPCEVSVKTADTTRTATVPTGQVEFRFADNEVGSPDSEVPLRFSPEKCTLVASGNEAHCSTSVSVIKAGTQTIRATYDGDATHKFGFAPGLDLHIAEPGKHATKLFVTCPTKAKAGSAVNCGVFVEDLGPNATAPAGKVDVVAVTGSLGGAASKTCTLASVTSNVAGCTVSYTMPATGSFGILEAHYMSDTTHTKAFGARQIENEF
jgi:hypothetical protein